MRIKVSSVAGVSTERQHPVGLGPGELVIEDVFDGETFAGQIVYRERRLKAGGSEYGWQPVKARRNSRLSNKGEAICRLLGR